VEDTHYKPGGTAISVLGKWDNLVIELGLDDTGCGIWSYVCLGKGKKKLAIVSVYHVGKHSNPSQATSSSQQLRTQYVESSARVDIDPFKQTLIDLEYFILDLKGRGYEVAKVIDASKTEDRNARPQPHSQQFRSKLGFNIDGTLDGSLKTFITNCGLIKVAASKQPGQTVPNTHNRRSKQIDCVLATLDISRFILAIGLLDYNAVFNWDQRAFFFDIDADGFFGTSVEALAAKRLRNLQLEDPRISQEYRKILHNKFTHHTIYKRVKSLYARSKHPAWSILDDGTYEVIDRDVT
jgi:hypothetical protein